MGQASFDAYLLANGPQDRSFLDLLKPYYEREIIRLRQPARAWRSALRNTRQAVLDHILLFMLWGALGTDDPLVRLAIRRAGPQEAGEAFGHLGWLIFRASETEPSMMQNAQGLWDWWRDRAQTRADNGDRDAAVAMVEGFSWWWRADNLDVAWQFKALLRVLEIAPAVESAGLVTQTISNRVIGNEQEAIIALDSILGVTANGVQLQDAVIKAQPSLRHLLSTQDPNIRRRAAILVQKIAGWGMVDLAKEITSPNYGAPELSSCGLAAVEEHLMFGLSQARYGHLSPGGHRPPGRQASRFSLGNCSSWVRHNPGSRRAALAYRDARRGI